ncbi:thiamine diphosphokinase [Mucilaginibacter terrae]|uniref:thiamine diphosphokinase n=1 Tax=Mucilaginibacter terrae TaxID=1955052 RepID=UPI0036309D09
MSSHHIVREKQEPALLVLGLAHFTDDELGQLLEWSPTLITSPVLAEQLAVYGIKIDYVVADNAGDINQSDVKLISSYKQPLLQAALNHLVSQGYPAVNVVTDELDLFVYEQYATQINLVIFYNRQKIYAINSAFSKWKPAGEIIRILTPDVVIETEGLKQLSPQEYQTASDGFFNLTFNETAIFISEEQ